LAAFHAPILPVFGVPDKFLVHRRFAWSEGVPGEFTTFYQFVAESGKKVVTAGQRVFLGPIFTPFSTFANFFRKQKNIKFLRVSLKKN
jgi:hypothetical protein